MATAQQYQWASGSLECHNRAVPQQPTKFEIVVRQLRLENDPQCWAVSPTLRQWAKKHKNIYYIPEELLSAWGMRVLVEL
jgi:hypothetical protein